MFTDPQVKALSSKLSAKHVRTRQQCGLTLSYIEGWHAIAEANRILGYDSWDRQTMTVRCIWQGLKGNRSACSYIARVRVRVRAGDAEICREGCGSGHGVGLTPGEAHESAIKEAETDAMKRALSTFGNSFGLALYDKEQQNVRGKRRRPQKNGQDRAITWLALTSEGEYLSAHDDPVDYCKAVRQLLEVISTRNRLRAFWQRNLVTLAMLRRSLPHLKSDKGEHYADILTDLYKQQMRAVWEEAKADQRRAQERKGKRGEQEDRHQAPSPNQGNGKHFETPEKTLEDQDLGVSQTLQPHEPDAIYVGKLDFRTHTDSGPQIGESVIGREAHARERTEAGGHVDKSNLPISTQRRIRDKEHLRYVASRPCIVCGRSPSQAHHLRFAQPSALARKVSDEWTVPFCSGHHGALHSVGDENSGGRRRG